MLDLGTKNSTDELELAQDKGFFPLKKQCLKGSGILESHGQANCMKKFKQDKMC